jgi:aminopeptidase C
MKLRSLSLAALVLLSAFGCSARKTDDSAVADENEIVDVPQTDVERQSIGNCWIYAHASWVESMHKTATGEDFDVSQSYWTYWHWFDQIAGGFGSKISTGGNWTTANGIIKKYGLMAEADFVALDTESEMSSRQSSALAALDASLASGALQDPAARRDKKIVRQEMDRAWGLTPEVSAMLDDVFGEDVTRTFTSATTPADAAGTKIVKGTDFAVAYPTGPGQPVAQKKLSNAMTDW